MNRTEKQTLAQEASKAAFRTNGSGYARTNCPFCVEKLGKSDRKRCFSVNHDTGFYRCFRCGTSGRLLGFNDPYSPPEEPKPQQPSTEAASPPENYLPVYEGDGLTAFTLAPARKYLASRNLSVDQQAEAKIGACATGRYGQRVVVPLLDSDRDTWLGWVARSWKKDAERKYLYPRGMVRSLYNHAILLEESDEPVYVVEGVFDALALWPYAVAVLGKPTEQHIEALISARRPVVMVLDGDAWEEGWALSMRLKMEGQTAGNIRLAPGVDPDEVDLADLWEAAKTSLGTDRSISL